MNDGQGIPILVNPTNIFQRLFNPIKNVIRTGRFAVTAFLVSGSAVTVTQTASDKDGNSSIAVDSFTELAVDVHVSAVSGTSPTYALSIDRLGADGTWYTIYTGASITAAGAQSVSLGVGASTNVSFGSIIRVRETIGGTAPSITRSISIIGK